MLAIEMLKENFPDEIIEEGESAGQPYVVVKKEKIVEILRFLHDKPELLFDHLADLTAVDWFKKKTPRFEIVYNLFSIRYKQFLRVKAQVSEEDPQIDSVTSIWKVANWFEREVYDMFGITFKGHPDLRRLIMPEDWQGYPLRKEHPLALEGESEWQEYKKLKEKAKEFAQYDWYQRIPQGQKDMTESLPEEQEEADATSA
ncbi:NADH (or F420H2) dehydrogenase, subunit C [Thermodesulfatator indicus DSM 15286]|uniref:NADH-quinone oxidoreductase subunit C n=1 Tax=Thermodesulfatator indicus (strain DSM 15286 / JCM 11887 / CIR29812) TaxID=667014 RepID=F8A9A7_THEID|nr:NADH-quinone oxidoreductase subunit C [Thermodesulfatator indicus]AEH45487.1 NADH (or F420H2) dehydrogenase, subunit C [Thermodesulfatator indicus DSM 15286]